jgi:RNA polymerase sigma-70 factor (ECF subfamily)
MRRVPGEDEPDLVARGELELRHRREVAAARRPPRDQVDGVGSRDRDHAVGHAADPRDDAAEVEAQDQLHPHRDAALQAARDADHVGRLVADRHRVDHLEHAAVGVEVGLQHQRVVAVAALDALHLAGGREQPAAVRRIAEQRGEAGGRVEPRQAQPVDRSVLADQRRRLRVADDGVVLDRERHCPRVRSRAPNAAHLYSVVQGMTAFSQGEELLDVLYAQHAAPLLAYVQRLLGGDRAQAEEVVQETFLRAWRQRAVLSGETARPWLYTVARRLVIDSYRKRRPAPVERTDAGAAAPDELEQAVLRWDVAAAFRTLAADHRAVLLEVHYRDRSVAEAARTLGIPEGTVRSRTYYALRALRLALEERGVMGP